MNLRHSSGHLRIVVPLMDNRENFSRIHKGDALPKAMRKKSNVIAASSHR
jgi:hypothetical protein